MLLQKLSADLLETIDNRFLEDLATPFRDVDDDRVMRGLSEFLGTEIAVFTFDPSNESVLQKVYCPPTQASGSSDIASVKPQLNIGHIANEHFLPLREKEVKETRKRKLRHQLSMDMFFKRGISDNKPVATTSNVLAVAEELEEAGEFRLLTQALDQVPEDPDKTCADKNDGAMGIISQLDIGHALDRMEAGDVLSEIDRELFLTKRWKPTKKEELPFSDKKRPNKTEGKEDSSTTKRYLGQNHLTTFPWLAISMIPRWKGAWCTYCTLFKTSEGGGGKGSERGRGGGQIMGKLVVKPLTNFADLTGKSGSLTSHQETQFHKTCALRFAEFSTRGLPISGHDVRSMQDKERRRVIDENRAALVPICDAILTCARQNLGFRGHRDDGPICTDGMEPTENDGNLRALLRFRMRGGDPILKKHLESAKR